MSGVVLLSLVGCFTTAPDEAVEVATTPEGTLTCASDKRTRASIVCADHTTRHRDVCLREACVPGGCAPSEICYPMHPQPTCVADAICDAELSATDRARWEAEAQERGTIVAAAELDRQARRRGEAPRRLPESPPVLLLGQPDGYAPVVCLLGDTPRTGQLCADLLPMGAKLAVDEKLGRSLGPVRAACDPGESELHTLVGVAGLPEVPWGWTPYPPLGWMRVGVRALEAGLTTAVDALAEPHPERRLELVADLDLTGDGARNKVIRATYPEGPKAPARSALWWLDNAGTPRSFGDLGLALRGVQEVRGMLPRPSGGAWLVLHSTGPEGSGLHVVGPVDGTVGRIAEVSCASPPAAP